MVLTPTARPTLAQLVAAPKVLLHDHLDGGMRPETVIELAAQHGYEHLPSRDPATLREWFAKARTSGSLPDYLAGFPHVTGVLQTSSALARAARENVVDLAADGIVYAETRFAPELHTERELTEADALDAVVAGTREGVAEAAAEGRAIDVRVLVCAQRHRDRVAAQAELVRRCDDSLVVGFDLGGPEAGYPAERFQRTFHQLRDNGVHVTIHAGEGDGVDSIRQAVDCGAERLGHGVRITDDIDDAELGPVADHVRRKGIVLEASPSSNVHSGAVTSFPAHPALRLARLGFAVTINTDNRLMSQTSLSQEFHELATHQDLCWSDVEAMTRTAAMAAFVPQEERIELDARVAGWFAAEFGRSAG